LEWLIYEILKEDRILLPKNEDLGIKKQYFKKYENNPKNHHHYQRYLRQVKIYE